MFPECSLRNRPQYPLRIALQICLLLILSADLFVSCRRQTQPQKGLRVRVKGPAVD
jgi:hypothetical protein